MRISVNQHKNCSACRACIAVCPQTAISMISSKQGFLYPVIDEDACVNCGLCGKVCQCENAPQGKDFTSFFAYYDDDIVRASSQSGGLFFGLAEKILSGGGIAYGSAVCDDLSVRQIRIDSLDDLHRLQGSKYVQSDTQDTFLLAADDLKKGKMVIYSGTSCMIDGLYRFLETKGISAEHLYTCDLVCHGVVSPRLYRENLDRVQKQEGKRIVSVNFRDKKFGWNLHRETYSFEDGSQKSERYYAQLMYAHVALRECCYQCQFVDAERKPADITMADFWGIKKTLPDIIDDNKGYSLALVHTEKGEKLLKSTKLTVQEVSPEHVFDENRKRAIAKPYIYDAFWKDYEKHGFTYCLKKYTVYGGVPFKIKRKIRKALKRW